MGVEGINKIDIQENDKTIKSTDKLWKMLVKLFPNDAIKDPWSAYQDFVDTKKHPENLQRLVAMETKERERQRQEGLPIIDDKSYEGTLEQNLRIREAILKGRVLPKTIKEEKIYENIEALNLSSEKIAYIKSTTSPEQYDFYIQNITSGIRNSFNDLSYAQFTAAWEEEMKGVEQRKEYIESIGGGAINNEGINKLGIINRLIDIGPRMDVYKQKYIESDQNIKKRFDKEVSTKIQNYKEKHPENYKKILEKCDGDEKLADEMIRKEVEIEVFNMLKNEGIITLLEEDEKEFAKLNIDFYDKMKDLGLDISDTFKNMYDKALNYLTTLYQSTDAYNQLSSKVFSDPEFNAHFDKQENKVEKLVADEKKSVEYFKNIIKLYPDIDTTNILQSFTEEYFTLSPVMKIKDSAPEELKKTWEDFLLIAETKDEKLLERTNTIIQQSAIEKCLTALQKIMDIDIDEGKNILDQIQLDSDLDAIQENGEKLLLNLKGDIDGKKIDLSYDLMSGEIYYKKYMQKAGFKDTDPIVIGSSEIQEENLVPFIKLPTLASIVKKGQNMTTTDGYLALMEKSESSKVYEKNLQEVLKNEYTIAENIDHELGQDMIKKNILEDSIVQKMLKVGEREFPAGAITKAQYPSMYNFYNYLYKSFEYYSMKPMVQLENWNDCIDEILLIKEQSRTLSPQELVRHEQNNKSQESFVLHGLVNQKVMGLDNTETRNQIVESNLLSFFQCFEKNIGGMGIIDVEMMNDYFRTAKRNTDEGELGKWKRNSKFTSLYGDFQGLLSAKEAESELMDQYDKATMDQYNNVA